MTALRLGCIADDYTGATDLAGILAARRLRVIQCFCVPTGPATFSIDGVDAIVIALKSRSLPADQAVAQSLAALTWLREKGASRFYFKYCSTFDSTTAGNIGPVAEALLASLGEEHCLFCPAFPENGRTVYLGHLFVNGTLLNESGMRHHPLTPMTDSYLPRVLATQSRRGVGLLPWSVVEQGAGAVSQFVQRLIAAGQPLVIADALTAQDLATLSDSQSGHQLFTGGSAWAGHLADTWLQSGQMILTVRNEPSIASNSPAVVLSGSCSEATRQQVAAFARRHPALKLDLLAGDDNATTIKSAVDWADKHLHRSAVLIYTTSDPEELRRVQSTLGAAVAAELAEFLLAEIAVQLVARGVRRLVVAGGETSGAIVNRLGIQAVRIGRQIAPGVPWVFTTSSPQLALALKSGNFGGVDFFSEALQQRLVDDE